MVRIVLGLKRAALNFSPVDITSVTSDVVRLREASVAQGRSTLEPGVQMVKGAARGKGAGRSYGGGEVGTGTEWKGPEASKGVSLDHHRISSPYRDPYRREQQ